MSYKNLFQVHYTTSKVKNLFLLVCMQTPIEILNKKHGNLILCNIPKFNLALEIVLVEYTDVAMIVVA